MDACIGIANVDAIEFKIYPNPAEQFIFVEANGMQNEKVTLKIFDALGRLIFNSSMEEEKKKIDLTEFSPGIFLLHVRYGDSLLVKQFVKN